MNTERKLLAAAINNRNAHDAIKDHLDEADLTEPGRVVLAQITAYYDRDPGAGEVDVETLGGLVLQTVANPKHKETFSLIMQGLATANVSGINVAAELLGAKREAVGAKLSTMLAAGKHNESMALLEEYADLMAATSLEDKGPDRTAVMVAPSLEEFRELGGGDLVRVYPGELNRKLDGGVRRGHHIVVFARPDIGKTMFLVNMANGFLRQGMKVLYILNEEPAEDVVRRVLGRMTERTQYDVAADEAGTYALATERGYGNFRIQSLSPGTPREVEAAVATHKPDVVFVDQVRNIQMKEDNIVRQLEKAASAMRQIGRRHNCVVISSTQAGDSASGKPVLDMGDVDSSNTGIPGACDVMIGIGAREEDVLAGRRVLTLCKNKRSAYHGFFPVRVDPALSKITSMTGE